MAKPKEKIEFKKLSIPEKSEFAEESNLAMGGKSEVEKMTRVTVKIGEALQDKAKDYAYWLGMSQEQLITKALEEFLKDKSPNPRPELVKARKVGRPKR